MSDGRFRCPNCDGRIETVDIEMDRGQCTSCHWVFDMERLAEHELAQSRAKERSHIYRPGLRGPKPHSVIVDELDMMQPVDPALFQPLKPRTLVSQLPDLPAGAKLDLTARLARLALLSDQFAKRLDIRGGSKQGKSVAERIMFRAAADIGLFTKSIDEARQAMEQFAQTSEGPARGIGDSIAQNAAHRQRTGMDDPRLVARVQNSLGGPNPVSMPHGAPIFIVAAQRSHAEHLQIQIGRDGLLALGQGATYVHSPKVLQGVHGPARILLYGTAGMHPAWPEIAAAIEVVRQAGGVELLLCDGT